MSYECNECGRDLRKGHSEYCSRWRPLQDHPEKQPIGYIDVEPTWESLLPVLMEMATRTGAFNHLRLGDERVGEASRELRKMARAADAYRALQKAGKLP